MYGFGLLCGLDSQLELDLFKPAQDSCSVITAGATAASPDDSTIATYNFETTKLEIFYLILHYADIQVQREKMGSLTRIVV